MAGWSGRRPADHQGSGLSCLRCFNEPYRDRVDLPVRIPALEFRRSAYRVDFGELLLTSLRPLRKTPDSLASPRGLEPLFSPCEDDRGRARTLRVAGKPIVDDKGQHRGYRGTATDIT